MLSRLRRPGSKKNSLDRFAWLILSGLVVSLVLGGVGMLLAVVTTPVQVASGTRVLGPRLFIMIGWLIGLLASCLPLAITELQHGD